MSTANQALSLQRAALATLWLSLFSVPQTEPLVLITLPALIGVQLWSPPSLRQRRRLWSHLIGLPLLGICLAITPMGDRGAWLAGFSNLLWLLCALKLLEVEKPGEVRRSALLLLIAIGAAGAFAQDLGPSLLQGTAALFAIGSLLALELGGGQRRQLLKTVVLLVAVSLPLMAALFVLAPRLGPLWLLQGGRSQTGLSDQLDPGSIASLAQSDAQAMRIQFRGMAAPEPAERYWRVLTLSQFDGRRWSKDESRPALAEPTPPQSQNQDPQLTLLLEPTNLQWLPWLGRGLPVPSSIQRSSDGGLWQSEPVRSRSLYRLVAAGPQSPEPWRMVQPGAIDLEVPVEGNPRLKQLGETWRTLPRPEQRLAAAERWFLAQGFRYTLEPGLLPAKDSLDVFLFEQREGFCEHFAAAFTALMREAAVPARVVIGYQGGEWIQPLGGGEGHLQVRQSDAHAWSEVWLPSQGWTRVDPTAWVVPSRLEQSLYDTLGTAGSGADQQRLGRSPSWLNWMQGQWQALDLNWSLWVMQFDQAKQEELLRGLLGSNAEKFQGALLLISLGLLVAGSLWMLQLLQPQQTDRLRRELDWCLRRLGITPQPGESLEACLLRARNSGLGEPAVLELIAKSYGEARFSSIRRTDAQRAWQSCIRQLARQKKRW